MISLDEVILGNVVRDYLWAVVWFIALVGVFWLIQKAVMVRVRRLTEETATDIDDTLLRLVERIRPPVFIVLALWVSVRTLTLTPLLRSIVDGATVAVLVYQAVITLQLLINFVVGRRLRRASSATAQRPKQTQPTPESALQIVNKISAVILWSLGALFILSNFGVDVTSLVAGLGVGGIAIALAAQNILGDLFSSLAIYLDKPFAVGDFIVTGDVMGTVTYVGIKTTRLRALSGEEIILSNRDLTAARIKNFRRMDERRVVFELGVSHETLSSVLPTISGLVQASMAEIEHVRFGSCNLVKRDGDRFVYEVVYHVTDSDFDVYRQAHQAIILNLLTRLTEEKIALTSLV